MKDEANNQRIKSEDIQTSAFQVHERRVYNPETHEYQQEGFTATQNTSVTIRDLEMGRYDRGAGSSMPWDMREKPS